MSVGKTAAENFSRFRLHSTNADVFAKISVKENQDSHGFDVIHAAITETDDLACAVLLNLSASGATAAKQAQVVMVKKRRPC
ncbi:MAG: hypothetical protein AAFQ05_14655 [Pseudomonadota bacterium]